MKKFWENPLTTSLVSLLLACLTVFYIDSTQVGFVTQGEYNRTKETASVKETIKVPLQVSVDTNQYYVVGYPEKVKLTLEGSNALVTSAINTQTFRAYIDLNGKTVGYHKVKVKIAGLSQQIAYTVNPKTIRVNIQRRKSQSMPVQIEYNKNAVADGFHLGKATVNPTQVEVTGAQGEVNQIDQIVAKAVLPNGLDHNYDRQVSLVAEDKNGRQLNVVIQPAIAEVSIPVSISKKTVKLNLKSENGSSNLIYSLTANASSVVLYGDKDNLAKVNSLALKVDLSNIDSSTTKVYRLALPNGVVRANPSSVRVQIKVKQTKN